MSPAVDLDELRQRWDEILAPFDPDMAAALALFADSVARYQEPHRFYHNLDHMVHVLNLVERMGNQAENLTAVQLAAWFHDVIYEIGAGDNEALSAQYAVAKLTHLGLPGNLTAEIGRLIRATVDHHADPDDIDAQILLDADLSSFGFEGDAYFAGGEAIRREFAHVPDELFYPGRIQVLHHFLGKERLFMTDAMHDAYEEQARHNIRAEISRIEERIAAMESS